jgi:protein TonB
MNLLRNFSCLLLVCSALITSAQDGQAARDSTHDMTSVKFPPEFPGGQANMYNWMRSNTTYPDSAYVHGIEGKVYVEFHVEKDGKVDHVVLKRGCNTWLDAEALRVIKKMPDWKPGRLEDGTAVAVRLTFPISFKLKK